MKSQGSLLNEMNEIVTRYHLYLEMLNDSDSLSLSSPSNSAKTEATRYIYRVFTSFMSLNDEEKDILNKEYFHRERNGWWIKKYKKEVFQNLLYTCVSLFLRRFYGHES